MNVFVRLILSLVFVVPLPTSAGPSNCGTPFSLNSYSIYGYLVASCNPTKDVAGLTKGMTPYRSKEIEIGENTFLTYNAPRPEKPWVKGIGRFICHTHIDARKSPSSERKSDFLKYQNIAKTKGEAEAERSFLNDVKNEIQECIGLVDPACKGQSYYGFQTVNDADFKDKMFIVGCRNGSHSLNRKYIHTNMGLKRLLDVTSGSEIRDRINQRIKEKAKLYRQKMFQQQSDRPKRIRKVPSQRRDGTKY